MGKVDREVIRGKGELGGAPSPGCLSAGCSTPLLVLGWLALGYTITNADFEVLQPFLTVIGWMLFLYGCFFLLAGLRNFAGYIAYRLKRSRYPEAPWKYEYSWNEEGYVVKPWRSIMYDLKMAVLFGVFALPWNMFIFHPEMPWFIMLVGGIFVGGFDCIVLYIIWRAVRTWLHWHLYGIPYIRWEHFPFRPGESMTVWLGTTQNTGPYKELKATLRLIEQIPSKGGSDRGTSSFLHYEESQVISDEDGILLCERDPVSITFQLPEDAHTTCLSAPEPWFWELIAEVPVKGIDFKAVFLIPVYKQTEESESSDS